MKQMQTCVKRMTAMLMAFLMVIFMAGGGIAAYAASTQTTELQITGIEEGSTVYAYAIAIAELDDNGNTYWKYNSEGSVESYLKDGSLSDDELIKIYTSLNTGSGSDAHDGLGSSVVDAIVLTLTETTGYYYAENVRPGLYVITADSNTYTYNPTVIAINYTYDENGAATVPAVTSKKVKSSTLPTIEKTVGDSQTYSDNNIGDTVEFTISIFVPDYDSSWNTENLRFLITDSLSAGLELDTDSIAINGTLYSSYNAQDANTSLTTSTGGFTLNLYGEDVYDNKAGYITITYSATITSAAGVNFDKEENKATLKYTTEANGTDLSEGTTDTTYHYTFGIDTTVNGTGTTVTEEITKYGVTTTNTGTSTVVLAGAQFQLTNSEGKVLMFNASGQYAGITKDAYDALTAAEQAEYGTVYSYVTTSSTGALTITGIDAGTYTLEEIQAPEGYSLDTTDYTVVITPTYTDDGELDHYTVEVSNGSSSITFTNTIDSNSNITITDSSSEADTFAINNTKLSTLPGTGSFGVIRLTFVAVIMMAGFGTAFMMLRKKSR